MRKKRATGAYKPVPFYPPSSEDFIYSRMVSRMTQQEAADLLHVSLRTVKNWESGNATIPYSAFKLIRIVGLHELPTEHWSGWVISQGALWSPAGRRFEAHELLFIGNMFGMARAWMKHRQETRQQRINALPRSKPFLRLLAGGRK